MYTTDVTDRAADLESALKWSNMHQTQESAWKAESGWASSSMCASVICPQACPLGLRKGPRTQRCLSEHLLRLLSLPLRVSAGKSHHLCTFWGILNRFPQQSPMIYFRLSSSEMILRRTCWAAAGGCRAVINMSVWDGLSGEASSLKLMRSCLSALLSRLVHHFVLSWVF